MDKIDLVIWTYKSSRTLDACLSSIERAIPKDRICHKIAVMGIEPDYDESRGYPGHVRSDRQILDTHGWDIYSTTPGIARQANLALKHVDSQFYASFEHDIILSPEWLTRMERIMTGKVAVAQGVRVETWKGQREIPSTLSHIYCSMDNNLLRTEVIRQIGGYPSDCPISIDNFLRDKLIGAGYGWIADTGCISLHLRPGARYDARHHIEQVVQSTTIWKPNPGEGPGKRLRVLFGSPIGGVREARRLHSPSAVLSNPLMAYVTLVTSILTNHKARVMKISP